MTTAPVLANALRAKVKDLMPGVRRDLEPLVRIQYAYGENESLDLGEFERACVAEALFLEALATRGR